MINSSVLRHSPAHVRRVQDGQVGAARARPEPGDRARARRASGSTRSRPARSGRTRCRATSATWRSKRGVDPAGIYDETAANIDLRRLPDPDEIADAVVFMASRPGPRRSPGTASTSTAASSTTELTGERSRTTTSAPSRTSHASATKLTGLTDFGGRRLPRRAGRAAATPTPRTRRSPRSGARSSAPICAARWSARLLSEAGWTRAPGRTPRCRSSGRSSSPACPAPAPPRCTGCSPPTRRTRGWSCGWPRCRSPARRATTWDDNPVFQAHPGRVRASTTSSNPEFMGVHYMAADTVEECWQLLRQSMHVDLLRVARPPARRTPPGWPPRTGPPPTARHRRNLQLIGAERRRQAVGAEEPQSTCSRWTRCSRSTRTRSSCRPTATPAPPLASSCSLSAHATAGWSERFVGAAIGRDQLDLWARGAATVQAGPGPARRRPASSTSTTTTSSRDPVGTVEAVYRHFDLPWTPAVRAAVEAEELAGRTGDRAPAHRYSLADFGLTRTRSTRRSGRTWPATSRPDPHPLSPSHPVWSIFGRNLRPHGLGRRTMVG